MSPREAQLQAQVQEQARELTRLRQENALLRQKVDLLSRKVFGCSSEKLSPGQLQLLLELAGTPAEPKAEEPAEPEPATTIQRVRQEGTCVDDQMVTLSPCHCAMTARGGTWH